MFRSPRRAISLPRLHSAVLKRARSPSPDLTRKRQLLAETTPSIAPSTGAEPLEFFKGQNSASGPWLHCNLPSTAGSFPVTLVSEILAQFVDDCEHHVPETLDHSLASKMNLAMSKFYDDEVVRAAKFREIILDSYLINLQAAAVGETKFRTDGHLMEGHFVCVISEAKNEPGSTRADPFVQAGLYYRQLTKKVLSVAERSPLPCLVMYYSGVYNLL